MWEQITSWLRLQWDLGRQVEENSAEIQQMRDTAQRLMRLVQVLASQNETLQREL